jgi:hypothetical protein
MRSIPIVLLAPAPGMRFVALPSGNIYQADANALVAILNGSLADETALIAAGCSALPGGLTTIVAALPAPIAGARACVGDAQTSLAAGLGTAVAGGGTNFSPVYADGTIWRMG